ncbi:MAG: ATP synthase F1 subunit delta [Eggerthellaceae bacterium]|nr:ATP synthase F1 subunit delta [Eggerthellaceae bacterium]
MPTNRLVEKEKVVTYAGALLDAANQMGGQEGVLEIRDELEQIVRIMRQSIDLTEALSEVTYSPEQRAALVRSVFAECNPVLVDVLAVMAERSDMGLLNRVCASFEDQITEKLNVTVVDVTTVVELDDHLRQIITQKTSAELGTDVVLREHIDASILGGILMSANGTYIDASVKTQLENARTTLKQTVDGGEC